MKACLWQQVAQQTWDTIQVESSHQPRHRMHDEVGGCVAALQHRTQRLQDAMLQLEQHSKPRHCKQLVMLVRLAATLPLCVVSATTGRGTAAAPTGVRTVFTRLQRTPRAVAIRLVAVAVSQSCLDGIPHPVHCVKQPSVAERRLVARAGALHRLRERREELRHAVDDPHDGNIGIPGVPVAHDIPHRADTHRQAAKELSHSPDHIHGHDLPWLLPQQVLPLPAMAFTQLLKQRQHPSHVLPLPLLLACCPCQRVLRAPMLGAGHGRGSHGCCRTHQCVHAWCQRLRVFAHVAQELRR